VQANFGMLQSIASSCHAAGMNITKCGSSGQTVLILLLASDFISSGHMQISWLQQRNGFFMYLTMKTNIEHFELGIHAAWLCLHLFELYQN
jgi:uncharacterized membrane protein YphA (DoxX/SURF4 family)